MSLINQMLKDLEQRGVNTTDAQSAITPQFGATSTSGKHKSMYVIGAVLVIIISGVAIFLTSIQPHLVENNLGLNQPKKTDFNNPATKTEVSKFGQSIEDKGIVKKNLPDSTTPLPTENDRITPVVSNADASIDPTEQPSHLFERTLKYNPDQATKGSAEKLQKTNTDSTVKNKKNDLNTFDNKETSPRNALNQDSVIQIIDQQASEKKDVVKADGIQPNTTKNTPMVASRTQPNIHKRISPEQNANSAYQQALVYLQQGRVTESQASLVKALELNPSHQEARLTLASLLLDNKRLNDAKDVLNKGLQLNPEQNEFRMALARLQINTTDQFTALNTLEQGLPYANNNAEYHAFLATLLQRNDRHADAITHYMKAIALESNTNSVKTNTLVGLGISLQSEGRLEDAKQAYTRAQQSGTLPPSLASFVEQQLKKISKSLTK